MLNENYWECNFVYNARNMQAKGAFEIKCLKILCIWHESVNQNKTQNDKHVLEHM